jgi:ABC-type glutathione transport system ATPase component
VRGLTARFGPLVAADSISFQVARGEALGIVGESGSGKTTVIRVLAGLNDRWTGEMTLLGEQVIAGRGRSPQLRRNLQMVFQDPYGSLHPSQSIGAILREPLLIHGMNADLPRLKEMLDAVQLPTSVLRRKPNQLSGGQRQRVAIARALITRPQLVLLDEPTSALDVSVQAEILVLLRRLQSEFGLTYIFVSHDLAVVAALCRHVLVMQAGRIAERTTTDDLSRGTVTHPYTASLLQASQGYRRSKARADNAPQGTALVVQDLRVAIPTPSGVFEAVRGVRFALHGDRLGIVGESGSGKSLTGRALLGLPPAGARVTATIMRLGAFDLLSLSQAAFARIRGRHIAMVLQDPRFSLNPVMSIGAQIDEVSRLHRRCSRSAARARSLELLDAVGITDGARVCRLRPHEVSGGMGQRVMIALMLAADPDVLIADEATSALDVRTQIEVLAVLDALTRRRQLGLIFISHDLRLVRSFCDRVAVMWQGEIVEQGAVEILDNPAHPYTRRLIQAAPTLPRPHLPPAANLSLQPATSIGSPIC